jgi:hypothetical protein
VVELSTFIKVEPEFDNCETSPVVRAIPVPTPKALPPLKVPYAALGQLITGLVIVKPEPIKPETIAEADAPLLEITNWEYEFFNKKEKNNINRILHIFTNYINNYVEIV